MRVRRTAAVAVAAALAAATLTAAATAAAAVTAGVQARVTIPASRPYWAVASRQVAGPALTGSLTARIYLAGRDLAGLQRYTAAVSQPSSPLFRHFLTAAQVRRRFGPAPGQAAAVRRWMTAAGLTVAAATQHYIAVRGSLGAAQAAFAVRFADYRAPDGSVARAPESDASVPGAVGPAVLTITGLDNAPDLMRPELPGPGAPGAARSAEVPGGLPAAFYTARPCSAYWAQHVAWARPRGYGRHLPWGDCGYLPRQLRHAYGVSATGSNNGYGVTVAIVDAYASPTMPGDASRYARAVGERPLAAGRFSQLRPSGFDHFGECGGTTWYREESLDIEAVHAMATGARIEYVAAADCTDLGFLDALSAVVDQDTAAIVSDSWDSLEGLASPDAMTAYNLIFDEGAAEGISFDFASGDCGYENPATGCGRADGSGHDQVDFPASSPLVTAVGGTSLGIGRHGGYQWQTAWGDDGAQLNRRGTGWLPGLPGTFGSGGGGGVSTVFSQPPYQHGVVPARLAFARPGGGASGAAMRVVPDVAMDADPQTGLLYGETVVLRHGTVGFQLSPVGGTSLASPLFAGVEADAAQTGGHFGMANPMLYFLADSAAYHDVTSSPAGTDLPVAIIRDQYSRPATAAGPIRTVIRTLGQDGTGHARLAATAGYDDATGLGSVAPGFLRFFAP